MSLGIPLAAGVWIPLFWAGTLNPDVRGCGYEPFQFLRSDKCPAAEPFQNGRCQPGQKRKDALGSAPLLTEHLKTKENGGTAASYKGGEKMTLKVEGMMCPHCEARVKKVLEEIDGVTAAEVSHEKVEHAVVYAFPKRYRQKC